MGIGGFVMRFGSSIVFFVGLGLLVGRRVCELQRCDTEDGEHAIRLKSLKRYAGSEVTLDPIPYTAGTNRTVDGMYGDIEMVEGTAGEVSVVFDPFNYRAHDAEDEARDE